MNYKDDNYQFELIPNGDWQKQHDEDKDTVVSFTSVKFGTAVIVLAGQFDGNLQQMTTEAISGLKEAGGRIQTTKEATVQGSKVTFIECVRADVSVFLWITLKYGKMHTLACSGKSNTPGLFDNCQKMASTFVVR